MYIEYACYDYSLSDDEIKHNIASAIKLGVSNIALHFIHLSTIKSLVDMDSINISCPIDYPYGISDLKTRSSSVAIAAKQGVSVIDVVAPAKFIANRKYEKLREDIQNNIDICKTHNIILRYILEYRVFNHETLAKTCQILKSFGVEYVLPSTGHMIDDINDNLIASKYLTAKSNIHTICNGNIWTPKHIETLKSSGIYGVRAHYIANIPLLLQNI